MLDLDNIIIIGDRVLVRPVSDLQRTNSGLYLPPGVTEKEKVQAGYVVKTGPGYPFVSHSEDDEPWKEKKLTKYVPLQAKEGDFALYLKKDAIEIELDKQKLYIVPHSAILLLKREDLIENL